MTVSATVIADSISLQGIRLTTFQLRYPKFIHGEAKTHRRVKISDKAYELLEEVGFMDDPALSRNASSSRAIPVTKLLEEVRTEPAMPVAWLKNKPGMQATEPMTDSEAAFAESGWRASARSAADYAESLAKYGLHKQWANRVIEPYLHINVVCTATDYANFYALRRHADAQPEMRALADAMWEAQQANTPTALEPGEWHLPYVTAQDPVNHGLDGLIKLSVARCARVSYLTHEGKKPSIKEDLNLYDRLVGSTPIHSSPAEHQAVPDDVIRDHRSSEPPIWAYPDQHGNLRGWRQFRKMLPDECVPG